MARTGFSFFASALVATMGLGPSALLGQGTPDGTQFQINVYTTGNQTSPDIATLSNGDFVVVWSSQNHDTGDTDGFSVRGRRYNSSGAAVGSVFQVNSYTTSTQSTPSISSNGTSFVVTWQSFGSTGTDTDNFSIQARRFDATANALGAEFQANTFTTSVQLGADVAVAPDGSFVVTWFHVLGPDGSSSSIGARRYDAMGNPVSSEFQVNDYTTGGQTQPSIAMDGSGNFVISWLSTGSPGNDDSDFSVQARRFDSSGSAIGSQFQVNTYTTLDQTSPELAMASTGEFFVVWESEADDVDTDGRSIQGQRYDNTGSPVAGEFQVNSYTTGNQRVPHIATDSAGRFVVAWQNGDGDGAYNPAIASQAYRIDGMPAGAEFNVNSYTTGEQDLPRVAVTSSDTYIITWESSGSDDGDTDNNSIQAQRFGGTIPVELMSFEIE